MCGGRAQHRLPRRHQRVAGAHGACGSPASRGLLAARERDDLRERAVEVLLDVVAERLERRDVHDLGAIRRASPSSAWRTSRSMHARNAASVLPDPVGAEISASRPARMQRPAFGLRLGGRAEARDEPFADDRMRPVERRLRLAGLRVRWGMDDRTAKSAWFSGARLKLLRRAGAGSGGRVRTTGARRCWILHGEGASRPAVVSRGAAQSPKCESVTGSIFAV